MSTTPKREAIVTLLRADPTRSSSQIAKQVQVAHTTVCRVRAELEAALQIEEVSEMVAADGRPYRRCNRVKEASLSTPPPPPSKSRGMGTKDAMAAYVKDLHGKGYNPAQIAAASGRQVEYIRKLLLAQGVALGRSGHGAKVSPVRVISELVNALVGAAHGVRLIGNGRLELPRDEAAELLGELRGAMRSINQVARQLQEAANGR